MKNPATTTAGLAACLLAGLLASPTDSWAQQRQKIAFETSAANSKYTQQHMIDVGDVPGHQVRVFEIQRVYGKDGPMVEGVRIKESWTRGLSDFTELNGDGLVYVTYVCENGDKIYTRGRLTAHAAPDPSTKTKLRSWVTLSITGGSGKFLGMRGTVRAETSSDPVANININKTEMEYWLER